MLLISASIIDWVCFSKHPKSDKIVKRYKNHMVWSEVAKWLNINNDTIVEFLPQLPRLNKERFKHVSRTVLISMALYYNDPQYYLGELLDRITEDDISGYPQLSYVAPDLVPIKLLKIEILRHKPGQLTRFLENGKLPILGILRDLCESCHWSDKELALILKLYPRDMKLLDSIWKGAHLKNLLPTFYVKDIVNYINSRSTIELHCPIAKNMFNHCGEIGKARIRIFKQLKSDFQYELLIEYGKGGWYPISENYHIHPTVLERCYDHINWNIFFAKNPNAETGISAYCKKNPDMVLGESPLKHLKLSVIAGIKE